MIDKNTYFDVGTPDSPVASNSSLSCINPVEGGSWLKFLGFFKDKEEGTKKRTLQNGTLLHSYIENPDEFVIEDLVKPTDMMANFIDQLIVDVRNVTDPTITLIPGATIHTDIQSEAKTEKKATQEVADTTAAFERLSELLKLNIEQTIMAFRAARIKTSAYKSQNEATVIGNIVDKDIERKYIDFITKSYGRIILNEADGKAVRGAAHSLYSHPKVSALLGLNNNTLDAVLGEVYKELAIYWQDYLFSLDESLGKIKVNCKALLDRVIINHQSKTITYVDLKTTGYSIYTFQKSMTTYRYYRQFAFYARALYMWFRSTFPDLQFDKYKLTMYIVPVETNGRFLTGIYEMDPAWINYGRAEVVPLVRRVAWHLATKQEQTYEEFQNKGILKFLPPC